MLTQNEVLPESEHRNFFSGAERTEDPSDLVLELLDLLLDVFRKSGTRAHGDSQVTD